MPRPLIPWRRFWHARGEFPQLDLDGYLADPEAFALVTPNVSSFSEIGKCNCLVLLGEPGMGKSTAMREAFEAGRSLLPQDAHMFVNLGQFTTDIALIQAV